MVKTMLPVIAIFLIGAVLGVCALNGKVQKTNKGYRPTPDVERPTARQVKNFNQQFKKDSQARRSRKTNSFKQKVADAIQSLGITKPSAQNPYAFSTAKVDPAEANAKFMAAFPGLDPTQDTVYYDPMGAVTMGVPVNYRHNLGQAVQPLVEAWDNQPGEIRHKYSAWTSHPHQKTLTTSVWDIPLHAIEGVRDVDEGLNPLSRLLPRVATSKIQIGATPRTARGSWTHLAESAENYTYSDDTFHGGTVANYTYDVYGYQRGIKTSAMMSLAGGNIANPQSSNAASILLSGRDFEEKQIFQGRNGGHASNFKGIYEFAQYSGATNTDKSSGMTYPNDVRSLFSTLRSNGAKKRTTIGATDPNTLVNIANALQAFVRTGHAYSNFSVDAPEIGLGLNIPFVDIDGHMVFESDGAPTSSGSREIVALDLSSNSLYMLQDITVHPLAKTGPVNLMGADAFGCMVSEAHPHIGRYHSLT